MIINQVDRSAWILGFRHLSGGFFDEIGLEIVWCNWRDCLDPLGGIEKGCVRKGDDRGMTLLR